MVVERLRTAYKCYLNREYTEYNRLMHTVKADLDQNPEEMLLGEWTLLTSLPYIMEPDKLISIYEEALRLIKGRSKVISRNDCILQNEYYPFSFLWRVPGKAEETGRNFEKAVKLYQQLTGNQNGISTLYQAQLAHFRGDFVEAERLASQAIRESRDNLWSLTVLGAAETLCFASKYNTDTANWKYAVSLIHNQMKSDIPAVSQLAQCSYSMSRMSAGLVSGIPDWIMRGHFGVVSDGDDYKIIEGNLVHEAIPNVLLTRVQYLLYSGEFIPAMNLIDLAQNAYHINKMPLFNCYADMFRAICWMHIKEEEKMKKYIHRAMERVFQDKLWVIASEFYHSFGQHLFNEASEYGEEFLIHLEESKNGFDERLGVLRSVMVGNQIRESLTNRELSVARLAAEGIKNKEIAERLGITVNTVKYHLSNAYQKMETDDRVKLKAALDKMKRETAIWVNDKK